MDDNTLVKDELIGRIVTIIDCSDPTWVGKTGCILDETKNTFLIQINNDRKKIAKNTATFAFKEQNKTIIVNGTRLTYRSENRIKKAR